MQPRRIPFHRLLVIGLIAALGPLPLSRAQQSPWQISEVFSNADGSVQYIELSLPAVDQSQASRLALKTQMLGQTLTSHSVAGTQQVTFDRNLPAGVEGTRILLATEAVGELSRLQPDYSLPHGFVPLAEGTLEFNDGADSWSIRRGELPLNGQQALSADGQIIAAEATNYAGDSALLLAVSRARYDAQIGLLTVPQLVVSESGVANVSFTVDLASLQFELLENYYFYSNKVAAGDVAARLRSDGRVYIPELVVGDESLEVEFNLLSEAPVRLGNPRILSTSRQPVVLDPELRASIQRGQVLYDRLCQVCHGVNGVNGTSGELATNPWVTTFTLLRNKIASTMPFDSPGLCLDNASSSCATDVSNYVFYVFQQAPLPP